MRNRYLITGGAGFIGVNLADHYLTGGKDVVVLDDFSRRGSRANADWLRERHGDRIRIVEADLRHGGSELLRSVEEAEVVFHLAGQVAVTTSVVEPRSDFEVNALGTFNVLEAVRQSSTKPILVYSSTNKVYGRMDDVEIVERGGRWEYARLPDGVSESRPLDFHSPYGCSKGAGDQYAIDYARIYGLRTLVFRQSCIYGPHQFGIEDQGWVAWFAIRALQERPVVIYGDGKQIRDVLFVTDLIEAYDLAIEAIDRTAGCAYNIGGGPGNTMSLLELIDLLERGFGRRLAYSFDDPRPGDQLVFVSDNGKAAADFGWKPRVGVAEGVEKLVAWLEQHRDLFPVEAG